MKKLICVLLAVCLVFALAACGEKQNDPPAPTEAPQPTPAPTETPAPEPFEWTRQGLFEDAEGNMLSVTWMDDADEPGWYVGCVLGETMAGWTIPLEGSVLRGDLNAWEEGAEPFVVTVSEEGEEGLLLAVEGGEAYHFLPMELPETIGTLTVDTEGIGRVACAGAGEEPDLEGERFTFHIVSLTEPASFTLGARADEEGWAFIKWTKDGEDYSTDPIITVEADGDCTFTAVFEWTESEGQNPVMNFIGEYQCERAHALVECIGDDGAQVTVEWGDSARSLVRWVIVGPLDTETLRVDYSGCRKTYVTYDEDGTESEEVLAEDGTGWILFGDDAAFTWHDDQSEYGVDMVFEWVMPDPEAEE